MTRRIEDAVAENSKRNSRLTSTVVETSTRGDQSLALPRTTISVSIATVEVQTRALNNSVIVGHPAPKHGAGRGGAGDLRGDWTTQSQASTVAVTTTGRNIVRDALTGQNNPLTELAVGSGTADADIDDTSLASETVRTHRFDATQSGSDVITFGRYRFNEHGQPDINEAGTFNSSNAMMSRITTSSTVSPTTEDEVRVKITHSIVTTTVSNAAVTSSFKQTIANSLTPGAVDGIAEVALGSGSSDPSSTDTSLGTEEIRKKSEFGRDPQRLDVWTALYKSEPSSQPVDLSELGLFNSAGDLLYRAVFDAVTKESDIQLRPDAPFKVES